jgi:hypothetical protein
MTNPLTDVGPATPPPSWCMPDTEPEWSRLTDGGDVCTWTRDVSDDVWVSCDDWLIDGRVVRSAPTIRYWEPPAAGITGGQAKALARALIAADVIADAEWLVEL